MILFPAVNQYRALPTLTAILLTACLLGPVSAAEVPKEKPIPVVVTLSVLQDLAEQVGRNRIQVTSLLSGFESQHTYTSRPADILAVRKASLLVKIGLGLDGWTESLIANAQNRNLIIVNTSEGIPLIEGSHAHPGDSAEDGGDAHSGNPHIWLDPQNAKQMVGHITDALVKVDPSSRDFYRENQEAYFEKLDELTRRMTEKVSRLENRRIITHHDAWPYFARRFGFEIRGFIVTQPGTEPSARHMRDLIRIIKQEKIRAIVSEPQLSPRFPQILADETGAKIAVLTPTPGALEGADQYSTMIEFNIEAIIAALGG